MAREEEALLRITARYVAEVQAGQQPRLSDYLARYPQYADSIADFVAYYHTIEVPVPVGIDADAAFPTISLEALQRLQARILQRPAQRIKSLLSANERTYTLLEMAAQLNLSLDIMIQLEQRLIEPATIPYELCKRLATALRQPVSAVQDYFQRNDQARPAAGNRAKRRPWVAEEQGRYPGSVQPQSFRQALETSLLISAEQAAEWQAILTRETLK